MPTPKQLWAELKDLVTSFKSSLDTSKPFNPNDVVAQWKKVWTPLRKALEYAKEMKLTGDKADKKLQELIDLGDKVSDPKTLSDFLAKLKPTWGKIRAVAVPLSHLGKPDFDAAAQKFIKIVDWVLA